jgi:tetratricopeptide (TPR) repeat protein
MLGLQGVALAIRGQWHESLPFLREAVALSREASAEWYRYATSLVSAGMYLGDPELFASALRRLLSVTAQLDPSGPYGMAIAFGCGSLGTTGQFGFGLSLLERGEALALSTPDPDPAFLLGLRLARAHMELLRDEPGRALAALLEARTLADVTRGAVGRAYLATLAANALAMTGQCDRAEEALRECESVGLNAYSAIAKCYVAWAQFQAGRPLEAAASVRALLETAGSLESVASAGAQPDGGDSITAAFPRGILALSLAFAGDLDAAEREARIVLERASMFPGMWACGPAALSVVALARGRPAEGLAYADQSIEAIARQGAEGFQVESLRTQALLALGRTDEARTSIARARDGILRIASTFEHPEDRASYLTSVTTNSAILALADALLGGEPTSSG